MSPMDQEAALHAAIHDRPHDSTPRKVLADYYEDQGMMEHAVAHRWLAEPGGAPRNHGEWREQTRGLDTGTLARVLSEEAHKSTGRAAAATNPLIARAMANGINHRGRRLSMTQTSSEQALTHAKQGVVQATSRHYDASAGHESLAGYHESNGDIRVPGFPRVAATSERHGEAGALHRQAQTTHALAAMAHDWHDHDEWAAHREAP